jgi:hypothetical protein
MVDDDRLAAVVETERANATLSWTLVGFVGLVVVGSTVGGDVLWGGFALVVLLLAVVPALAHRRATVMLPWEVLALATLPLVGRVFTTVPLTGRFVTYLAVAALALVIAVELHSFTAVEMTPGFAVGFVVVATVATAGVWAVVRWLLDVSLGTTFVLDPAVTAEEIETHLMWEFVYSTLAGVVAGVVFEGYFRRRDRTRRWETEAAAESEEPERNGTAIGLEEGRS